MPEIEAKYIRFVDAYDKTNDPVEAYRAMYPLARQETAEKKGPEVLDSLPVQYELLRRRVENQGMGGQDTIEHMIEECKRITRSEKASPREKLDAIKQFRDLQKLLEKERPAQSLTAECLDFLKAIKAKRKVPDMPDPSQ